MISTKRIRDAARILATAICVGIGVAMVWANVMSWGLEDWQTYLVAAERVANGGPVYEWTGEPEHVYRYAPWFAFALTPFLIVPRPVADVVWSVAAASSVVVAVLPLLRRPSWASVALAVLMMGLLIRVASTGNVHPILIAVLVIGLQTRVGPVVVALSASLKAAPILFTAVYVAQRRWWAAATTIGLTGLLVLPMIWLGYQTEPGPSESIYSVAPAAWILMGLAALAAAALAAWRGSRRTGIAAGAAAYLVLPRAFLYDISLVLPGVAASRPSRGPTGEQVE